MAKKKEQTPFSLVSFTDNSKKQGGSAMYGFGFIGSLIYFLQAADNFWEGLVGILQALVWPAYIAYKLLEMFNGAA